jgi:osmotically inducible protein OsmC
MALDSTGRAHWEGDLFTGHGTASVDSGAFGPLPVDWKARAEDQGGKTNPEELIAAAHATCFSMAFSNVLAKNETPPTSLDVSATITFVPGTGITTSKLAVTGVVPGIDEAKFRELAEDAKANCPVSKALTGNVELSVEATLAGA